jgi:hypothetical protein
MRLATLSIEKSFGGFVRGQLIFALLYAVLSAIIMVVPPFQLNLWLIGSLVAGLCMLIPLVGNLLALIPPILILLLEGKGSEWLLFFLITFGMQSIMVNVLGPRIMSSSIGIHPIYVWAAILIGGQVAGIWGVIFGIPIAGALNLIGRPLLRRLRHQTALYRESGAPSTTTASFLTGPLAASLAESRAHFEAAASEHQATGSLPTASLPTGSVPAEPAAVAAAVSQPTGVQGPEAAVAAPVATQRTPLSPPYDDEEELVLRPAPTLTARAWRMLFVFLSKLRGWARERVQARGATRQ